MSARDQWLAKGLVVLAAEGFRAVTIERLCVEVGLSKGSFYHHFRSVPGYRAALLERFEYLETERYVEEAERSNGRTARERLNRLMAAVVADADGSAKLELAMRTWAAQDDAVRVALEGVDRLRLDYLEALLAEVVGSKREARDQARTIYLILLGGYHLLPPVPIEDIARLWSRLLDGYSASPGGQDSVAPE